MEFHVCWLIEVIGCISDDHLNKPVPKGIHGLRILSLSGVRRKRKEKQEHQGNGDFLLHHAKF